MPAKRPPAPRMTTAPMRCAESNFAATARLAVGSIETMSPPKFRRLAARIVLTFMAASLRQDRRSKRDQANTPDLTGTTLESGLHATILPGHRFRQHAIP